MLIYIVCHTHSVWVIIELFFQLYMLADKTLNPEWKSYIYNFF